MTAADREKEGGLLPAPTRRLLVCGVVAAGVFGGLAAMVQAQVEVVEQFDAHVHQWALDQRSDLTIALARGLSLVGGGRVTVPALFVVGAVVPRGPRPALTRIGMGALLAGLAALGGGVGVTVNHLIGRERPPVGDWAGVAAGPSFPSGHTTTATLFALACGWVLLSRVHGARGRLTVVVGLASFAVAVGCARIWLGVHWPTDVLGGWSFAVAWSVAVAATVLVIAGRRTGQVAKAQVDRADAEDSADRTGPEHGRPLHGAPERRSR